MVAIRNLRTRNDGRLMFLFTAKHAVISLKQHRRHVGNLRRQIYLLQRSFPELQNLNR